MRAARVRGPRLATFVEGASDLPTVGLRNRVRVRGNRVGRQAMANLRPPCGGTIRNVTNAVRWRCGREYQVAAIPAAAATRAIAAAPKAAAPAGARWSPAMLATIPSLNRLLNKTGAPMM